MASLPDSSDTNSTTPSSLETGLEALKQGHYQEAIAYLEPIAQTDSNQPTALKAQMGLVMAYEKIGDGVTAIALCQTLTQHPNAQMREWATRTLSNLTSRYPQTPRPTTPPDQSGFVPLDSSPLPASRESVRQSVRPAASVTPVSKPDGREDVATTGATVSPPPNSSRMEAPATELTDEPEPAIAQTSEPPAIDHDFVPPPEPDVSSAPLPPVYQPRWKQAGRAKFWNPLSKVKPFSLWALQVGTVAALFLVIWAVFKLFMTTTNNILYYTINFFPPIQAFYSDPFQFLAVTFLILLVTSPWLLEGWLKMFSGLQSLSIAQLADYSPEAARILPRLCQSKKLSMPALGVLPCSEPIAFSYGCLPRFSRIVVSQGLLDRLSDDELATIYAAEVGHIFFWDAAILSLAITVLLIPYSIYWQFAAWGDRLRQRSRTIDNGFLRVFYAVAAGVLAGISAIAYGLYWLWRLPTLWLSRQRVYYSDRFATEATGNPNGLTRALLKIAIATAETIQEERQTSYLLEGLDLLLPIGHRMAVSLGSLYPHTPLEPVLMWDLVNPYRYWLTVNNSHPLTGDRLQLLTHYARHWKLDTELALTRSNNATLTRQQWRTLLLMGAPFFGVPVGAAIAIVFWLIGGIAGKIGIDRLAWFWGDRGILFSCILIGFSIGTIVRFNHFFPDLPSSYAATHSPRLPDLLSKRDRIPLNNQPIQLEGTLLGRQGIGNWLAQDLLLQTATGVIKLHYFSQLGPISNLLSKHRPCQWVNQPITVVGWFRRGATPWIDAEAMRTSSGKTLRSGHQVWSTVAVLLTTALGLYLILRSGT